MDAGGGDGGAGGGGGRPSSQIAFDLQNGGGLGGVLARPDDLRLGARQPPGLPVERIPAQAEAAGQRDRGGGEGQRQQARGQPAQGRAGQAADQKQRRLHGKALRSSSKCGPSRRRGQSPPQTRATP